MGDAMAEIERLREQFIAAFEAGERPTRASSSRSSRAPTSVSSKRCSTPTSPKRRAVGSTPRPSQHHRPERSSTTSTSPFPASQAPGPSSSRASATQRGSAAATSSRGSPRALGVTTREAKVERYYHEMEQGLLPPAGVSDRVLDALASLLHTTRERLREAGASPAAGGAVPPAALFARTAAPTDDKLAAMASAPAAAPEPEARDEVDELFLGG